jgi:hypothetical protein
MITLCVELIVNHAERHSLAWAIGGLFMLLAVFTSFHDIAAHLLHYSKPVLQRYVVRIMLMARLRVVGILLAVFLTDASVGSNLRN